MFDFDLQIFAEEESAEITTSENTTDNTADNAAESVAEPQEKKEPIPDELAGIDEDIARETMAEAKALQDGEQGDISTPKGNIPYSRFKEKVDETNTLKAQLEAYKKKYGDIANAQPQSQPSQPAPAAPIMQPVNAPQQTIPQFKLTPEITAELNKYCQSQAMQMTGMSQEDVDSIKYMENDDPRKSQYEAALKMAESTAYARIQQAQQQELARREAFLRQHNASVAGYNEFAKKEMAEPDYPQIVAYATGDYFKKASPADQETIAAAYNRVEHNTASPQDIMLVKQFYSAAKAAYRRGSNKRVNKAQEAQSFPRSLQVDGVSDSGGNFDPAALEKMLDTTPWDKIPKHIQNMLKGV